jgi:hypothetical protein
MSTIENIEVFCKVDVDQYLVVLLNEFGAQPNPHQEGTFVIDDPPLPFYKPRQLDNRLSVLGFNYAPLSSLLILALIDHPELAPPNTIVRWSAEQEVVAQGSLVELAWLFGERPDDGS